MKKRIGFGLLAISLVLTLFLAACGDGQAGAEDAPPRVAALFPVPDPASGGGFDRANVAGLRVLEEEFGWHVSIAENVPYPQLDETAISFLTQGYDMIMYFDAGMMGSFETLPYDFPDQWFVMFSIVHEIPNLPNVAAFSPDFIEWGMITGMAMAEASETGIIGILGGAPIPALLEVFSGVIEGARFVDPEIEYIVHWTGDWNCPARHSEMTMLMVNAGADVTFASTGAGARGVYEAAEASGTRTMGFAWDVYDDNPAAILGSLMFNTPRSFAEFARAFESGTLGNEIVNLDSGYFEWADFRGSISPETESRILELTEQFKAGEIVIPLVLHPHIMQ